MMVYSKLTLDQIIGTPARNMIECFNEPRHGERTAVVQAIECNDGTRVSVQASATAYCTPRDNLGPWSAVEVGFPTADPPDSWREYCDGKESCWDAGKKQETVYGYVPVELVREFIESHGGEKPFKTDAKQ